MKKIFTVWLLTFGIVLISGCTLVKQKPIDTLAPDNAAKKEYLLYYHNLAKDRAEYNYISFDERFILPVKKNIPMTKTPIKDVFTLLFEANLTEDDLKSGFVAGVFDTYDLSMRSLILNNGVLTIDFMNPDFTLESLSSAENGVFVHSLRKTAQQFPEIEKIQFQNGMVIGVKNPNDTQM